MDRDAVSYCSGLQYQKSFSYVHMVQCFQAALLTVRDLGSLFDTQCALQSDIPESTLLSVLKQGPFHSQPQTTELHISLYLC